MFDECGAVAFGGFAAALLSVADIDSASGDELLEAAERLAANRGEREAREKPAKRYEHLTRASNRFYYSKARYSTSASVGMDCWAPTFVVAMALAFVASATESASDRPRAYPATMAPM